jgi:hypothetical protein
MKNKNRNKVIKINAIGVISLAILVGSFFFLSTSSNAITPSISKGSTASFGVLAATTITNTGTSSISGTAGGNLGLAPGTDLAVTGVLTVSGETYLATSEATTAQTDLVTAYNSLSAVANTAAITADLGGTTLYSGSYSTDSGIQVTDTLTLDAQGDATAVFIFKAGSTLVTATNSTIALMGGAQACNVYWQVGSSATIGVGSKFVGNVYAMTSISALTGAQVNGQLLARTGAVTLDGVTIVNNLCDSVPVIPTAPTTAAPINNQPTIDPRTVTSINNSSCLASTNYQINLSGNFPTPISNVAINYANIDKSFWVQSLTNLSISIPFDYLKPSNVIVYFGDSTQYIMTEVDCPEFSIPEQTATEKGGLLPTTATNNYNNLIGGITLIALGLGGLLIRRRLQA